MSRSKSKKFNYREREESKQLVTYCRKKGKPSRNKNLRHRPCGCINLCFLKLREKSLEDE